MNSDNSFCFRTPAQARSRQGIQGSRGGIHTSVQYGLRRTRSEKQHLVIGLGIIFEFQAPEVGTSIIVEVPKLHPVIILVRDDLPQ